MTAATVTGPYPDRRSRVSRDGRHDWVVIVKYGCQSRHFRFQSHEEDLARDFARRARNINQEA
jgi:hypothetical protein